MENIEFQSMLNLTTVMGWGPVFMENKCGIFLALLSMFFCKKDRERLHHIVLLNPHHMLRFRVSSMYIKL
jgi:hypothetical protein